LRPSDSPGSREKYILYVGRIHPEKGLLLLMNAFSRLVSSGISGWKLLIVGPWEFKHGGGGRAYYEKLRYASHGSVEFTGPVFDEHRLNEYYDKAAFFVYPSLAEKGEAFGLSPLEAMARGCPALVSSLDCFKDFIQADYDGWVFNHRGPDAKRNLESSMREIISNSAVREIVSRNALATANQFTIDRIASLYLEDFEKLLHSKGTLPALSEQVPESIELSGPYERSLPASRK
jgi:glycosyltransferase involved in cell wall biosynthesis